MSDRETGERSTESESTLQGRPQGQADSSQRRPSDDLPDSSDLSSILSYLISSGQVRILASRNMDDDDDDYFDDDDDFDFRSSASEPQTDKCPDVSKIQESDFRLRMMVESGSTDSKNHRLPCVSHMLRKREVGMNGKETFSYGDRCQIGCCFLPNKKKTVASYRHKAFCGTFACDGNIFLSACQDQNIRVYDTRKGEFNLFKTIRARDVGWSVLDTAFSPDSRYLIYSSWSECIHLCNIYGDYNTHESLHLVPNGDYSFCIFSLTFSTDNHEILGGANDGFLYVYNRERNERTLKIDAHQDDVNAVAFADDSSNILFSGADDGLLKVWDRRTLSEENPHPVGVLAGHMDGITFIDSKGDGRHLISNCKDQTIKLWDIRKFSSGDAQEATKREVSKQNWDYRWQQVPKNVAARKKAIHGDSSLMTYRGHCVLHTLIRSRFSPAATTGQRYIYSGCATGAVIIYDSLTGKVVKKLRGHKACVRDISWHPYESTILSTSWDGSIGKWTYRKDQEDFQETKDDSDFSSSDSDDSDSDSNQGVRRSKRLKKVRHQNRQAGRMVFF